MTLRTFASSTITDLKDLRSQGNGEGGGSGSTYTSESELKLTGRLQNRRHTASSICSTIDSDTVPTASSWDSSNATSSQTTLGSSGVRRLGKALSKDLDLPPVIMRRRPSFGFGGEDVGVETTSAAASRCGTPHAAASSQGGRGTPLSVRDAFREVRELSFVPGSLPGSPKTPLGRRKSDTSLLGRRHVKALAPVQIPPPVQLKDVRELSENEKIYDLYYWDEVLQETGDGGKVVVCRKKDSPRGHFAYVMKIRSKASLREQCHEEEFRKSQIRMLNFPPHVGVMPLREVLEDDNFYYMVMDKAKGGGFFYSLLKEFKDGVMPPKAIRNLIKEILEAVSHVHDQGMLHRDIKPDNLVMQVHDDPNSPTGKVTKVMLIDFDHADPEFSPVTPKRGGSCYGTLRFNAPETLRGDYYASSDLYSVGVILYLLMTGKLPYDDDIYGDETLHAQQSPKSRHNWMVAVYRALEESRVDFDCSPWPDQTECRDFCAKLLAFGPEERFQTAQEALASEWVVGPKSD